MLFWIGLAIMVMTTMLRNFKETGFPFLFRQRHVFLENIWSMTLSDLAMTASTVLCLPVQKLYLRSSGILRWGKAGIWIQSAFQAGWLLFWTS